MARPSPGAQRFIAVLNFFADHPDQAFSLTDIIKALRLNRSTGHSLLAELVQADYLYRTNDKMYLLGPAIARLGRVASSSLSPLHVAQPELRALADEYDVICSAIFRERNDLIFRAQAASVSHLGYSVPRGARLPLRPQFAGSFFAWTPKDQLQTWLDQLSPPSTDEERRQLEAGMCFMRDHGFVFTVRRRSPESSGADVGWLYSQGGVQDPIETAGALNKDEIYSLASVTSGVFDDRGRVAFIISLSGVSRSYSGAEIARIGGKVHDACQRITHYCAGLRPTESSLSAALD